MTAGAPTIGGLNRVSYLPTRSGSQGALIAGQLYNNVYFTGGNIIGVNVIPTTTVVTASGGVNIPAVSSVYIINKAVSAATAISVATPTLAGTTVTIKDGAGNCATYNITITPISSTIDDGATAVMNINYSSLTMVWNGSAWNVI